MLERLKNFLLVFPVAVLATGCTALESRSERTWLALHAVDVAQTDAIVGDPCYREGHPVTRALIGAQPSHRDVIAWGVASAAVHIGVTELLLRHDHPKLARAWQFITIGEKAYMTGRNFHIGVRIGGRNEPPPGCTR